MGNLKILNNVQFNKNQVISAVVETVTSAPSNAVLGQIATINGKLAYYNGSKWITLDDVSINVAGSGNVVSTASVNGHTITLTKGVTALTAHANGYGKVAVTGSSTATSALSGNTATVSSSSYNDTLKLTSANTWVVMSGTDSSSANSDEIKIAHKLSGVAAASYGQSSTADSSVVTIPYITVDAAGHITSAADKTVRITGVTPAPHAHGNITSSGTLANASYGVVTDGSKNITAIDMTVSSPGADGNTVSFIDTVSQSSQGKISATKKTIPDATASQKGIMLLGASGGAATYGHTHSNMVTGSGLTADTIILGNGSSAIKTSSKTITATAPSSTSTDASVPTSKAVWEAVLNGIASTDAMVYKGALDGSTASPGTLTPAASTGFTYKVGTAGNIDGKYFEAGDMLICNTDTPAATSSTYSTVINNWDQIQTNLTIGSAQGNVQSNGSALSASMAVSTDSNKKFVSTDLTVNDTAVPGKYVSEIDQSATGKITVTRADLPQPSNFKTVSVSAQSTAETGSTGASSAVDVVADSSVDTLTLKSANKWVTIGADANADSITIGHAGVSGTGTLISPSVDGSLSFTEDVVVGVYRDTAGHITGVHTKHLPNTPTHYQANLYTATSATGTANASGGNSSVYLNLVENSTIRNSHQLTGATGIQVATDASGKITISHTHTDIAAGSNVGLNSTTSLSYGGTFIVPYLSYDAQGHITGTGTKTLTLPGDNNTTYTFGAVSAQTGSGLTVSYEVRENSDASVTYYNNVSGTLKVANGGTGATTLTSGNLLVGNGASAISAGYAVTTQGSSTGSVITASSTDTQIPTSKAVYNAINSGISNKDYYGTVTPAANNNVTVTHNLGSKNVIVSVFETSAGNDVMCDITRTGANTVALSFGALGDIPTTTGSLTVCIHRCD